MFAASKKSVLSAVRLLRGQPKLCQLGAVVIAVTLLCLSGHAEVLQEVAIRILVKLLWTLGGGQHH
jgi:hypothetical protein